MPGVTDVGLGRRERKNAQTRAAIVRAALELAIEQGYERTTIAQIAERADVATRTVHSWFRSKDDIVLSGTDVPLERLRAYLDDGGESVIDRLEDWVVNEGRLLDAGDDLARLRLRALAADARLLAVGRPREQEAEGQIAAAVRRELALPAEHAGPELLAAAAMAMLVELRRRYADEAVDQLAARDDAFSMLRGARQALRATPDAS